MKESLRLIDGKCFYTELEMNCLVSDSGFDFTNNEVFNNFVKYNGFVEMFNDDIQENIYVRLSELWK